jgi:hypothetical protein
MLMKMLLLLLVPLAWAETNVQALGWIAGCWEMRNPSGTFSIEEMWTKPAGETMLGVGRTIRNGKTIFNEFLRIGVEAGKLTYFARIGTKDATQFPLLKMSDSEVVFENPTHDFPQRIVYRKTPDGMFARIEGVEKGKEKHQDFPYKRVSCQ